MRRRANIDVAILRAPVADDLRKRADKICASIPEDRYDEVAVHRSLGNNAIISRVV